MNVWNPTSRTSAVDAILQQAPVLPVLTIERLDDAVPLARALVDGGLPVLEVTLRSAAALEAITLIRKEVPGAIVGAGTILDPAGLRAAVQAGAMFAISPGASDALYVAGAETAIPFIPAIATATELLRGIAAGHQRFKFFPAEAAGGVAALKAFFGPFPEVGFCPTGGIDAARAPVYLALGNVVTVGGSWMVPADAVRAGDWPRIRSLAEDASRLRKAP